MPYGCMVTLLKLVKCQHVSEYFLLGDKNQEDIVRYQDVNTKEHVVL